MEQWHGFLKAHRPSSAQAHKTHFKTFLSLLLFYGLPMELSAYNILIFFEFSPEISCHVRWFTITFHPYLH